LARDLEGHSDEELFVLCRDTQDPGEIRAAVGILAKRHHAGLVRYLVPFTRRVEVAEDLAQEAFIRIYKHAREYRSVAKVSTWLYRIATNLALNEIRDRKRRPAVSLNAPFGEDGERQDELADGREPSPVRRAEANDLAGRVREAIGELPELYRAVMLLCDLQGMSYEEAAEALGIKVGTIRSRLFRAREQFQEKLGPAFVRDEL
jgi:RNA polymerase sigma-70 factor (ECF subfamily)